MWRGGWGEVQGLTFQKGDSSSPQCGEGVGHKDAWGVLHFRLKEQGVQSPRCRVRGLLLPGASGGRWVQRVTKHPGQGCHWDFTLSHLGSLCQVCAEARTDLPLAGAIWRCWGRQNARVKAAMMAGAGSRSGGGCNSLGGRGWLPGQGCRGGSDEKWPDSGYSWKRSWAGDLLRAGI